MSGQAGMTPSMMGAIGGVNPYGQVTPNSLSGVGLHSAPTFTPGPQYGGTNPGMQAQTSPMQAPTSPIPAMSAAQHAALVAQAQHNVSLLNGQQGTVLPNGTVVDASQYGPWYNPAARQGISDQVYGGSSGPGIQNMPGMSGDQYAVGRWVNGSWQPETRPAVLAAWAQQLGVPVSDLVNPSNSPRGNPANGWSQSSPLYTPPPATAQSTNPASVANSTTGATTSALSPSIGSSTTGVTSNNGGDINGTMAGASTSGYGGKGASSTPTSGFPGGKGSSPYGGKGSSSMPTGTGGYTSSPYGAPNYGSSFLNPNTLPMGYGNGVSGWSSPSMTGDGFSWYGGQAPIPEGGTYNQMAQMMAGPSYSPAGSNWYSMAPGQTANFGPYGSYGGKGSSAGKGASPYGYLSPPNPYQPLSSYADQYLGNTPQVYPTQASPTASSKGPTPLSPSQIGIMGGTNPYGSLGYSPQSLMMARF